MICVFLISSSNTTFMWNDYYVIMNSVKQYAIIVWWIFEKKNLVAGAISWYKNALKKLEFLCESRPFNDFNSKVRDVLFFCVWNWLNLFDLQWSSHLMPNNKQTLCLRRRRCVTVNSNQTRNTIWNVRYTFQRISHIVCVCVLIKGNLHLNKLCGSFTFVMQAKLKSKTEKKTFVT